MANSRKPGLDRYTPEEITAALAARRKLQQGGRRGGKQGSARLTPEERTERARMAAEARWGKKPVENS